MGRIWGRCRERHLLLLPPATPPAAHRRQGTCWGRRRQEVGILCHRNSNTRKKPDEAVLHLPFRFRFPDFPLGRISLS